MALSTSETTMATATFSMNRVKESNLASSTSNLDADWAAFGRVAASKTASNALISPDDEWEKFCTVEQHSDVGNANSAEEYGTDHCQAASISEQAPESSPIYISTKTKIAYLNTPIPLEDMFWAIPVVPSYASPEEGIVKKEMKFKTVSQESLDNLLQRVEQIPPGPLVLQNVKNHVESGGSNVKFKDIRKVSVGLCKKQMTSFRSKAKGAFFNCFAVILRMRWEGSFKEMHVKVFNTGKLEIPGIPGIRSEEFLKHVLDTLVRFLAPLSTLFGLSCPLNYKPDCNETVLTNSNFTANYLIDREKLCGILRRKYKILSTYDPCSYPGVQSKFYYVNSRKVQDGRPFVNAKDAETEKHIVVPFMVFRTGSVLIVGKFDDDVLMCVYNFTKSILKDEYNLVQVGLPGETDDDERIKKVKKRFITKSRMC